MLRRVGAWFARLHALDGAAGSRGRGFRRARRGLPRARRRQRSRRGASRRLRARACAAARGACRRPRGSRPATTTCITATSSTTARGLLAVDWEYAGPGDPAADLASCIGYHALGDAGGRCAARRLRRSAGARALRARARSARLDLRLPVVRMERGGGRGTRRSTRRTGAARGAARRLSGCADTGASGKMRDPWPRSP